MLIRILVVVPAIPKLMSCHGLCLFAVFSVSPVGYHKVIKHDELSESEEEIYIKDDPEYLHNATYK